MQALHCKDLTLSRGKNDQDFRLGPIDLELAAGSRTALVGPSGCGKTTLLRCLAGLETPERGTVQIGERTVQNQDSFLPPGERNIGFVFQDGALWPHMNPVQHLRFVDPGLSRQDARELLAELGLEQALRRKPGKLSGGEVQRLALARALVGNPKILLLDEPLRSVDANLRSQLAGLVRQLVERRGLTLLLVTHDRDEALAMADDLVVMQNGAVMDQGPALRVLRQPKTVFSAGFLSRAVCLPTTPAPNGQLRCAFGDFTAPQNGHHPELVVLPGDVRIQQEADQNSIEAHVLHVQPGATGLLATVAFSEQTMELPCVDTTARGDRIHLGLIGPPRFLNENSMS